jgi:hypothetical protein
MELASQRHCIERIRASWGAFCVKRRERLAQQERHGIAAERVAENIVEDLFTMVLDWPLSDVNNQVEYADLLLTSLGIKYLLIEVKRPGALAWSRRAVEAALAQARRYADEQKVSCVAVSDGYMLYAADVVDGGLRDRLLVSLDSHDPQEALWWLSVHGIYRPRESSEADSLSLSEPASAPESPSLPNDDILHPKYRVPASCFAYVGHAAKTSTWKLPFRTPDGNVDLARLPKAIQCILSNYRGVKVSGIPENAVPDVLVRLANAAASLGKMPHQAPDTAPVYHQLAAVLDQLGRLSEIAAGDHAL